MDKLLYDITRAHIDLVRKVASSCRCKTIRKEHVQIARDLAEALTSRKKKKPATKQQSNLSSKLLGGAETVLPSEYFGRASGVYSDAATVAPLQYKAPDTSLMARGALPASLGAIAPSTPSLKGGFGCSACSATTMGGAQMSRRARGGAETVLPSEYFGRDSGRYFAHDLLPPQAAPPAGLARPALPYAAVARGGSGSRSSPDTPSVLLSEAAFTSIVQEYKKRVASATDMRLSEDARKELRKEVSMCAMASIRASHAERKTTTITAACIELASDTFQPFAC
jgi:hypothetical protein